MSAFGGNQDTSELPITIYNQELVLTFLPQIYTTLNTSMMH